MSVHRWYQAWLNGGATARGKAERPGHVWRILRGLNRSGQRPALRAKESDEKANLTVVLGEKGLADRVVKLL